MPDTRNQSDSREKSLLQRVHYLNEVGIALSSERNHKRLLEKILLNAKLLTGADGGTLYSITKDKKLRFEIVSTDSLGFHLGGTSNKTIPFEDIPLFKEGNVPNVSMIGAYAALHGQTVNIEDAYTSTGFDFSGPREFDRQNGYRTKSVLAIPIKNHEEEVVAVLQLINAKDDKNQVISFSEENQQLAESLASQAGVALTNQQLILELKELFNDFVKLIAGAIDAKSPSTGNHGRRVPIIAEMIGRAVNDMNEGAFQNVFFTEEQIEEIKVAAFLHDCGKITTPEYLIEKHTKLETIFDRIELVRTRFEVLKRDLLIELLEHKLKTVLEHAPHLEKEMQDTWKLYEIEYEKKKATLHSQEEFIERCNVRIEEMTPENQAKVNAIASRLLMVRDVTISLLTADEAENLSVAYGNLTNKERKILENHVVLTYKMLSQLPFPKNLANVPEIAAAHHERIDGKGYPKGLTGDEMSIQSRILAVADVFEALSAPDRAYKKPMNLSLIYTILEQKVKEGHLDSDIVDAFMKKKVALKYAQELLAPEQIDI
jgi:HD-GYP domain-containing protein (c-di-GMP phosphodiesterase class II)